MRSIRLDTIYRQKADTEGTDIHIYIHTYMLSATDTDIHMIIHTYIHRFRDM